MDRANFSGMAPRDRIVHTVWPFGLLLGTLIHSYPRLLVKTQAAEAGASPRSLRLVRLTATRPLTKRTW